MNTSLKSYVLQPFILVGTALLLFLLGVDLLMVLTVEVFIILCFVCFKNIYSNIFFFFFLVSFFVFLISGDLAEIIFNRYYYIRFGEEAIRHSRISILISLIFLYLGYMFSKSKTRISIKTRINSNVNQNIKLNKIRFVSKYVYFFTYIILLINTIDKIRFVFSNGYVAYYTSYSSFLPSVISEFADFAPIALCIFLATFPTKKECKGPLLFYFIYAFLSLFAGSRGVLIYNIIFLLGYIFYRNYRDHDKEVWIAKKSIVALCLSVPFLFVFLFLYGYVRLGENVTYNSFGDTLVSFFINIGSSSTVIKYGYEYQDSIEGLRWFSLGDTLNYFKYGKLFNLFDSGNIPSTHSAEFALQGHSFDSFISYQFMRIQYLNGEGSGSSFIATLFADFGYVGVAIGSMIYGIIFKRISFLNNNQWLSTAIKLYIYLFMIKSPRGSYDSFLGAIVNMKFILILLFIYLIAASLESNNIKKNGI